MKFKPILILISILSIAKFANGQYCTNDDRYSEVEYFNATQISMAANVQYGSALDYLGNPYTLMMDIYYPNLGVDPSPKRPFVMLFHGGGFVSGDKQSGDIKDLCIHMAQRGFVCATVNYRLGYDFTEYGQYKARYRAIQDGHAALRYIVQNANTLRIDTDWIFVGGQSAGSLLSLGLVYAEPSELDDVSLLYNTTSVSSELGNLYTSGNNLTNTYTIKGIFNNWGAVAENEVDVSEMKPTIAFHGDLDTEVLIGDDNSFLHYTLIGSSSIHTKLNTNSICSELTIDLNGEHGIFRNESSVFRAGRASCFFKSIFCSSCTNFYSTDSIPPTCSATANLKTQTSETEITVFPNPTENTFTIRGIEGELEISIYNSLGQSIHTGKYSNGMTFSNIPPGIYNLSILQIESNKQFTTHLVIK